MSKIKTMCILPKWIRIRSKATRSSPITIGTQQRRFVIPASDSLPIRILSVGPATVHTTTTSQRFLNMSGWSNSAISVCRHTAHIVGWIKSSVKASAEKWFRLIGLTKTACVRTAQRCSETVLLNGIHAVIAGR